MRYLCDKVVVFDLDDTLYKEIDYLESAFKDIANDVGVLCGVSSLTVYQFMIQAYYAGEDDVFQKLIDKYSLPIEKERLLLMYRQHKPKVAMRREDVAILAKLKSAGVVMGLMTDGRSLTQRNKIEALGLDKFVLEDNILISEESGYCKPSEKGCLYFIKKFPDAQFWYVGDNVAKDFFAPNKLGWTTIGLKDDGRNIHKQIELKGVGYMPNKWIDSLSELLYIVLGNETVL